MNIEKLSVPVAIIIAGGLIAGALYYSNVRTAKELSALNTLPPTDTFVGNMRPVSSSDHILGNPAADIIIVEYSDLECPFCKAFHATLQRVMSEYGNTGKVAWVYRHFPIANLHSKAQKEAEATECANELGGPEKFWEYTNLVYATTNSNDSLDPAELPKIAKAVGLDVKAFNTCLSSGKYKALVEADYADGIKIGISGTPTSVLVSKDGTKTMVKGAQPYEQLKTVIDALLK